MSIIYGELNLLNSSVDLEYRILILEQAVEFLAGNPMGGLPEEKIRDFKDTAIKQLQKRYPSLGIKPYAE